MRFRISTSIVPVLLLAANPARPALAVTFTVGPGGAHSTIQAAIDAALAAGPEDHEIRIAQGTYPETLRIPAGGELGTIRLRGGWRDEFRGYVSDPRLTVVDAAGTGRTLTFERRSSGRLTLDDLTFRRGSVEASEAFGGNLLANLDSSTTLEIRRCRFVEGAVLGIAPERNAGGGGIAAFLYGKARLDLELVEIERSRAAIVAGELAPYGGGLAAWLHDSAELVASGLQISDNVVTRVDPLDPSSTVSGAGLFLVTLDQSHALLHNLLLQRNHSPFKALGAGGSILAFGESTIELRRAAVLANRGLEGGSQLDLSSTQNGHLTASDSIIALGDGRGLHAQAMMSAEVRLSGWTVTGNGSLGGSLFVEAPTASLALFNSIFWHNGGDLDLSPGVEASANLVSVDPRFVDEADSNYNLAAGSSAIDAGEDFPPGGVGPTDFLGHARIQGRHVDQGAYETEAPAPTAAGDPVCRVLSPDGLAPGTIDLPIARFTNVCTCLRDFGLREARCSVVLPEIELVARFPRFFAPGEPVPVRWAIHPWTDVRGAYALQAAAEIDGEWVPQTWLGPVAPGLKLDEIVVEPFEIKPALAGSTPLRTTLAYKRANGKWEKSILEILLPAPIVLPK